MAHEPLPSAAMVDSDNRISALEKQVQALLQWQQSFCTAFTPVLARNDLFLTNVEPAKSSAAESAPSEVYLEVPTPPATPSSRPMTKPRPLEREEVATESAPILSARDLIAVSEPPVTKLATEIVDIIQRYGQNTNTADNPWASRQRWLAVVERYVEAGKAVRMILPAFPWKSLNKVDKVVGALPDFGEELAMAHLNGLCESISEVYEHGAQLTIASDGLVYNGE